MKVLVLFTLCLILTISNARVVNMLTTTTTDMFGNTATSTSFTIPNNKPNGWDQLFGSSTDQATSFNTQPVFHVDVKSGDSVRDMNNPGVWYTTNMAGQIDKRCVCAGHGNPCNCS